MKKTYVVSAGRDSSVALGDLRMTESFPQKVLTIVRGIPSGSVMTYREVAVKAGSARAYRSVGNILHKNYDSAVPCHRVIRSDGQCGGYNRGKQEKIRLLRQEGA